MLEQVSNALTFLAFYTASKQGKTGLDSSLIVFWFITALAGIALGLLIRHVWTIKDTNEDTEHPPASGHLDGWQNYRRK